MSLNTITEAIKDIKEGKMIIVIDDEDRENEGDLVMAADAASSEKINFMISEAKGLVCVPVIDEILEKVKIQNMVTKNTELHNTAFTVSIDANRKHGVTTGISAKDRAKTIQVLIDPKCTSEDLVSPGHIFPLRARKMGVLRRAGHTEAAVDLARLAGFSAAGVICEIINPDGSMARLEDLKQFAKKHSLKIISIKDLITYRIQHESFIEEQEVINLPTKYGEFKLHSMKDTLNNKLHLALTKGNIQEEEKVLVRIHSECCTGDIFHSLRCDCGEQLDKAMQLIEKEGKGAILYLRQEGRGIGLENKLKAYKLQEKGLNTVEANKKLGYEADLRDYGIGAQILLKLKLKKLKLLTNNPKKIIGLEGYGIQIVERIPIIIPKNKYNKKYLSTKKNELGHIF
ncbi:MAG: bifunctional 3,4-dihydroxy-2-butanone-4-phosphate synthase/GTP cyclohydrolase II [bacterium]